jgi:hypothetical protein
MTRGRTVRFAFGWGALALAISLSGCITGGGEPSAAEQSAIADSLKRMVISAYDLSNPNPVASLMSLYPLSGPVVSASGGKVTTTRKQLEDQIRTFWTYVGSNMKDPKWVWTSMRVDVLSRDGAVMTSTYRIPHKTPMGMAHVIGGAWTAVFARRGGRWVIVDEHLSDSPTP